MGNGNRSSLGYNMGGGGGGGDNESGIEVTPLECDVGLGLNMQHSESDSYPCKKTTGMPRSSPYNHHSHHHQYESSAEIGGGFGGGYGDAGSGGVLYGNPTSGSNQMAYGVSFKSTTVAGTGGVTAAAAASGKVLFTESQWQELERQTMIYKYIVACIPVPPPLLLPLSTQSSRAGTELRYSSGSDPEPWRCKRTDGKKWRCSRDVAPDQKYCERHAHKTRPRSRKPVEIQPHNTNTNTNTITNTNTTNSSGNKDNYHSLLPPAYMSPNNPNNNTLSAATLSCQQPRGTEWFMKSGTIPVSSSNQQFQQPMVSSRVGSKMDHILPQDFEGNQQQESHLNTTGATTSDPAASARRQNFIDAWCRGRDNCSLTLSMQSSGNGTNYDHENFQLGVGFLDSDRGGSGDVLKSQNPWLNPSSWMVSPPGGPLGEALCLGIASSAKGPPNVPTGYNNSSTTSSSCEDGGGSHGPRFTR